MQVSKNEVEQECRMFWRTAVELMQAAAQGHELFEFIDELDVLRDLTDNEMLKERCTKLMLLYAGRLNAQRPAVRSGP